MATDYKLGFLFGLLITLSLTFANSPPEWPTQYTVEGLIELPYAEIKEPFIAFWDSGIKRSRVDYYGGVQVTLQIAGNDGGNDYGENIKVVPMTTEDVLNKRSCFQANGTKDDPAEIQSVLPDLSDFTLQGSEKLNGIDCDVWQKVEVLFDRKNTYTMWVTSGSNKPVRYQMMGYDSLLGSHYDKYYIDYFNFIKNISKADVFKKPNITCTGFPGPGSKEHRVLMNPMSEFINGKSDHIDEMFHHFKNRHGAKYPNDREERKRMQIFTHNVRFIQSTNRAVLGYSLSVNHLADRTSMEISMMRGRKSSKGYNGGLPFDKSQYDVNDIPDYVDWRLNGAVTPVKDQAICGSCWSFGTAGAVEGAYFMKTGRLERLSQQELVDCSWGEGNNGCDGGEDFRAYQWIMKNGLTSEDQYGMYLGIDSYCHAKNVTPIAKMKGYVNVTSGDLEALKLAMSKHGPISVSIDASQKSFSFYSNGVYYNKDCKNGADELDHSVLAVGFGVLNSKPYWLIKNSWSTYWGNDGYILISMKNNNCGVATAPTFVLM